MKQTAVEWFFNKIKNVKIIDEYEFIKLQKAFDQAKQMEKEQIIDAHNNGKNILPPNENGEQYYNETF